MATGTSLRSAAVSSAPLSRSCGRGGSAAKTPLPLESKCTALGCTASGGASAAGVRCAACAIGALERLCTWESLARSDSTNWKQARGARRREGGREGGREG
jgi:hypothetical protein